MAAMEVLIVSALLLTLSVLNEGKKCLRNRQCGGGYCDGGGFWRTGVCASLISNGYRCLRGDHNSCRSKRCICNHCADVYGELPDGYTCATDANCKGVWCKGRDTVKCRGTCFTKLQDGEVCHYTTASHCISGQCTCGTCGRKLYDGLACSTNYNCKSGWCQGQGHTIGCQGTCGPKGADGAACSDDNYCSSGQCTCGICGRRMDKGKECSTDDNCHSRNCRGWVKVGCAGTCA